MNQFKLLVFQLFLIISGGITSPVTSKYNVDNSTDMNTDSFISTKSEIDTTVTSTLPNLQENSSKESVTSSSPSQIQLNSDVLLEDYSISPRPPSLPVVSNSFESVTKAFSTSISTTSSYLNIANSSPNNDSLIATTTFLKPTFRSTNNSVNTLSNSPPKRIVSTSTQSVSTQTSKSLSSCEDINDGDDLTQVTFLARLTAPCRYDKLTRPGGDEGGTRVASRRSYNPPVNVHVQLDIRHVEATENLQFKLYMLLQYRYRDDRLNFAMASPGRARIVGEESLRERIWVPHLLIDNERESAIMGHDVKDIYMSVEPNGEITFSRRIKATLYCWMNLQKFPFDEQECFMRLVSWTYNASELLLKWEEIEPVVMSKQLHLTEYSFLKYWTEECIQEGSKQNRGAFIGNYSCLTFHFHMAREMGYYMLDYFIPSIMLVCLSWVSFWLQADASAPRITLGISTMLSFITLATAQTRNLPKVSYIKASEIWFLGCTCFIFGSMVEFAFVNIIWRRKADIELMKVNSKNILQSTLTPRLHRKQMMKASGALQKSHSCSSLDGNCTGASKLPEYNNYLTVHSFSPPKITTESVDDLIEKSPSADSIILTVPVENNRCSANPNGTGSGTQVNQQPFTKMTPQEISQWIDKRSRLVFPCAFIVFNAFYWGFVYWL